MKLKLKIDTGNISSEGAPIFEEKTFMPPFISARMLKDTIKLQDSVNTDEPDDKMIDEIADYIVKIYSKQFTIDQLLDGIAADQLVQTFMDCVKEVCGKLGSKMEQFKGPNP